MLIQRDSSVILKTRILGIFRWIIFKLTFDVLEVQSLTECRILWLWIMKWRYWKDWLNREVWKVLRSVSDVSYFRYPGRYPWLGPGNCGGAEIESSEWDYCEKLLANNSRNHLHQLHQIQFYEKQKCNVWCWDSTVVATLVSRLRTSQESQEVSSGRKRSLGDRLLWIESPRYISTYMRGCFL